MEECLLDAMSLLTEISEDTTVSKNVKQLAVNVIGILKEDCDLPVKCDRALQALTITDDPNIDMFTKTRIWSLLSILESIT